MEIFKKIAIVTYIMIALVFLNGCNIPSEDKSGDPPGDTSCKEEIIELRRRFRDESIAKQELLDVFFNDLSAIQSEISQIGTEDLIYTNVSLDDVREVIGTERDITVSKIRQVRALLEHQDRELDLSKKKISELQYKLDQMAENGNNSSEAATRFIQRLRSDLAEKDRVITILKNENINLQVRSEELQMKIEDLEGLLSLARVENNRRYVLIFSRKDFDFYEWSGETAIQLPYPENDIMILSSHQSSSYFIRELSRSSHLLSIVSDNFWSETKFLIIRVARKRL